MDTKLTHYADEAYQSIDDPKTLAHIVVRNFENNYPDARIDRVSLKRQSEGWDVTIRGTTEDEIK